MKMVVGQETCGERIIVPGLPNPIECGLHKGHRDEGHAGATMVLWTKEGIRR